MSTNINGYIFRDTTLETTLNQLINIEKDRTQYLFNKLKYCFIDYLFDKIDNKEHINLSYNTNQQLHTTDNNGFKNINQHLEHFKQLITEHTNDSSKNDIYDCSYYFCLIPNKFKNHNNIYMLNYCSYLYKDFLNKQNWESYNFWNGTDGPKELTYDQWTQIGLLLLLKLI